MIARVLKPTLTANETKCYDPLLLALEAKYLQKNEQMTFCFNL